VPAAGRTRLRGVLSFIFVFVVLFLGFTNTWKTVSEEMFQAQLRHSDARVVARLVRSHQSGLLSDGGFLGYGTQSVIPPGPPELFTLQYQSYTTQTGFSSYYPYMSQNGGQALFFGLLDRALPMPPGVKLSLFYALTALLSTIVLAAITLWFAREFGVTAGLFVLGSVVFSQWLLVFGHSLFWSVWAFYLPMLATTLFLERRKGGRLPGLVPLVFLSVLLKCLFTGYEFITTTLIMMLVPVVYYAVAERWGGGKALKFGLVAASAAGAAVVLSALLLCLQFSIAGGGLADGVRHMWYCLGKRTYGNPAAFLGDNAVGLRAGLIPVILQYITGVYFDGCSFLHVPETRAWCRLLNIRYLYLIVVFLAASVFVYASGRQGGPGRPQRKVSALLLTTWFSILAPLSWFVLFKAHAALHMHLDFIVWQMPFTLYGAALCGVAARTGIQLLLHRTDRPEATAADRPQRPNPTTRSTNHRWTLMNTDGFSRRHLPGYPCLSVVHAARFVSWFSVGSWVTGVA
jgi:hypothetical protein